jgi:hypothetical protein
VLQGIKDSERMKSAEKKKWQLIAFALLEKSRKEEDADAKD